MKIGSRKIDKENSALIIAELSANHNGSLDLAKKTIQAARKAGADAIKLQTYTADTITLDCRKEDFKLKQGTIWDGKYLYDLYKEAYTPWEWHEELFKTAAEEGLICFSSPFDFSAVDFLEKLETPAYKIASFEITDIPLIEYVASKMKPVIISTGIARSEDIQLALETCRNAGNNDLILLKCTSSYPAPFDEANLLLIPEFEKRFGVISGLSDHTLGYISPIVAITLGAKVIEKHFILDHSIGGPDASFSLDQKEFGEMVNAVRQAEASLGEITYALTDKQIKGREFSRSLYVTKDIKKGEKFSHENIRSIRPGFGISPKFFNQIIGSIATQDIERGESLQWKYIEMETK